MRPCGIFNANMQTRYMFVCTLSEPVFVQNTIGPALCNTAASVVSALASVLFGIDVIGLWVVYVFGTMFEQLHFAVTEPKPIIVYHGKHKLA